MRQKKPSMTATTYFKTSDKEMMMQLLGLGWKYNGFTVIAIDKHGITVKMKSVTKQIPLDKVELSKCEQ